MEARNELAPRRRFDLVVMAASAGGVKAFQALLSRLRSDFPLPIAIVQHRSTRDPNLMAKVSAGIRRCA